MFFGFFKHSRQFATWLRPQLTHLLLSRSFFLNGALSIVIVLGAFITAREEIAVV